MRNSVTSTARMIRQQVRQALKPTLKVRRGAIDRVAGMTATPDTRYLTSSLSDRSLRVWDFKLGTQAATVQAPAGDLTAVALTDGGEYLLALSNSNAYVTDLTDDGLYPVPLNGVSTLAALGNERAVFGTESGEIVLWSLVEGKSVATLNLGLGPLQTLSVQADRVLAGARGGFAQVVVVPNGMYKRRAWPRGRGEHRQAEPLGEGSAIVLDADGSLYRLDLDRGAMAWNKSGYRHLAPVAKGRILAVSESGSARLLDVDTGAVLKEFPASAGKAGTATWLRSGELAAVAGDSGEARIYGQDGDAPALRLLFTETGWAAVDGKGRYDGDVTAFSDVVWDAEGEELEIDRFAENYYEPGVAAKQAGPEPAPMIVKPPKPVEEGIYTPPVVKIRHDGASLRGDESFRVEISATLDATGVKNEVGRLAVFHNGKRLWNEAIETLGVEEKDGKTHWRWRATMTAITGPNRVEANLPGWNGIQGQAKPLTLQARRGAKEPALFVASFGINLYQNADLNLNYAVADAQAMRDALLKLGEDRFVKSESELVLDADAKRVFILKDLGDAQDLEPQDRLIVFLSGHGRAIGDEWYFMPYDTTSIEDDFVVQRSGISSSKLAELLTALPVRQIVVIVDSCQSGAAIEQFNNFVQRRSLKRLSDETGVHVLAATRADQLAPEYAELGHGIFTYTLLNGLKINAKGYRNADVAPRDGKVMVDELRRYTEVYVPRLARALDKRRRSTIDTTKGVLLDRVPVTPVASLMGQDFAMD